MPVQTVTGAISADDLGRTLMHEHLFVAFPGAEFDPAATTDKAWVAGQAVRSLEALKSFGVKTFVDPCPIELGRDVRLMAEIAERAEMQIVCTTGFYHEATGLPGHWRRMEVERIVEHYVHEIEQGIEGTGIRAGAIKCATSAAAISPMEAKFLTAACRAHKLTGVPIITHTENGIGALEQQAFMLGEGVAAHRCLIGHCCGTADRALHSTVAERGSCVGFDRIGYAQFQADEVRADSVVALVRAGHAERVILSQDRVCHLAGRGPLAGIQGQIYSHMFTDFLPMLRERGLTDDHFAVFLDANPRRFFAG
jgi:phosphotriesterase-related protein